MCFFFKKIYNYLLNNCIFQVLLEKYFENKYEFHGEDFEASKDYKDGKDLDNKYRIRKPQPFQNFFDTLLAKRIRSGLEHKKVHNYDQKD